RAGPGETVAANSAAKRRPRRRTPIPSWRPRRVFRRPLRTWSACGSAGRLIPGDRRPPSAVFPHWHSANADSLAFATNTCVTSTLKLHGVHHITAIATDPQRNLDFYTGFLGMRLVKRTVNFDDPSTYHFYFGDRVGT